MVQAGASLQHWTEEEVETLRRLRADNVTYDTIAVALGRNALACQQKAFRLGLSKPHGNVAVSSPSSLEDLARKNYDTAVAQLEALEVRRGSLLSEMAKAMKVLVALGLEDEKHMCAKCGQEFVRKGDLTAHVNREHPTTVLHVGEGVIG